jgi:hypothetical protein
MGAKHKKHKSPDLRQLVLDRADCRLASWFDAARDVIFFLVTALLVLGHLPTVGDLSD